MSLWNKINNSLKNKKVKYYISMFPNGLDGKQ